MAFILAALRDCVSASDDTNTMAVVQLSDGGTRLSSSIKELQKRGGRFFSSSMQIAVISCKEQWLHSRTPAIRRLNVSKQ